MRKSPQPQRRAAHDLAGEGGAAGEQRAAPSRRPPLRRGFRRAHRSRSCAGTAGHLLIGRADPVHHLDREAVGVERAARGEDDGGRRRARSAAGRARTPATETRSERSSGATAVAMRGDLRRRARSPGLAARSGEGRCRAAYRNSRAPVPAIGALRGGPEPAFERLAHLALGHCFDGVTPGAERSAGDQRVRLLPAAGTSSA